MAIATRRDFESLTCDGVDVFSFVSRIDADSVKRKLTLELDRGLDLETIKVMMRSKTWVVTADSGEVFSIGVKPCKFSPKAVHAAGITSLTLAIKNYQRV